MKVNLDSISKRAQGLIETPKFFKPQIISDFEITLDAHDKILTVFHRTNPHNMDFIFAEVLARFSENKKIADLWKINFREIESFLRDENHLPAFTGDLESLENILRLLKISLIAQITKVLLKTDIDELLAGKNDWSGLPIAAKNRWAQKLIRPLGLELVLCESEILTVTNMPEVLDAEGLERLLSLVLGNGEKVLPMKVVAV